MISITFNEQTQKLFIKKY